MTSGSAPFTLAGATSHPLHAAETGGAYLVDIAVPDTPPPPGGYPLVLLLDGAGCFGTAVEAVRRMGRRPDATAVTPLVVVAVRTAGSHGLVQRQHDFTTPVANRPGSGGAAAFMAFLQGQVLPLANGLAPIDPERRTLFGHSLAGYFTLWVLAHHRQTFRNYTAVSPSVWWDRDGLLAALTALPAADHRVLLTLGAFEEALPPWQQHSAGADQALARRQSRQVRAGIEQVAALLSERLGPQRVRFELLADEDHASIVSAAIPRMLRLASRIGP